MSDMDPEGNVNLLGVDMEVQEATPQVIEIDDTKITQVPSIFSP